MDINQYYPTPKSLASRCWQKFENRVIVRLLEPSAGTGELLHPVIHHCQEHYHRDSAKVDAAEIDLSRHARLRELGVSVVAVDFLEMENLSHYSHILMNPPFAHGADHVLHAWDRLFSGEIVAIINAETIRNPCSRDRQRLVAVIHEYGDAEFVREAFMDPDTLRKTEIEIAIIHLTKKPEESAFRGGFWHHLEEDQGHDAHYEAPKNMALRGSTVVNLVRAFNAAWDASRTAIHAELQATYYRRLLGGKLGDLKPGSDLDVMANRKDQSGELGALANTLFAEAYDDLKDRAWSAVMYSTDAEKYVSTKVRERLHTEFEQLKKLDFTAPNLFGFLMGLAENHGNIQLDMACEVFDKIIAHHSDNTLFFMGWKSNDKHRVGMAIKSKRFILPGFSDGGWRPCLGYEQAQRLRDIDKVFAMLDGKEKPEYGLVDLFQNEGQHLRDGNRGVSSYFEVRHYRGVGTIHFYPTNPKLIDRLNTMVGRARNWLPEHREQASKAFWRQHAMAEKITRESLKKHGKEIDDAMRRMQWVERDAEDAQEALSGIILGVAMDLGFDPNAAMEAPVQQERLALTA
ncbi:DUF4942 domain-containing protein [Acidithiobacillus sp. MC6.1]|nr:DUF4942 domain-containing protein [Acidithiobacillus sp. MC6.1]